MTNQRMVANTGNDTIIRWIKICLTAAVFSLLLTFFSTAIFAQAGGYEGDVTPRPNGKNGAIASADYEQIGRFATNVDAPTQGSEFQRADCAPRNTLGDGKIGIADLVQGMRYAAGLDALTAVGGPATAIESQVTNNAQTEMAREVKIGTPTFGAGTITIPVELVAIGNENALGFTISYDTSKLSNPAPVLGADATSALLLPNANALGSGRLGIGIALPAGQVFAAGTKQVLRITFSVSAAGFGTITPIGFASSPVQLEISDALGNLLDQRIFTGSQITLNYPTPAITTLSPDKAIVGGNAFTLTVIGSNFVNGSIVKWNSLALATTYVSSTVVTATVPAAYIAAVGSATILVFNPAPGGGNSNSLPFSIVNPVPMASGFNVTSIAANTSGSLEVNGSGFVSTSVVYLNGRPCPTRFISGTKLVFDYLAVDIACAGKYTVSVVSPAPGGGTSTLLTLIVAPTITTLNPNIAYIGNPSFTAFVTGTGFCSGATIMAGGIPLTTTFVSATQLSTFVSTELIASLGGTGFLPIQVRTADGVLSNTLFFEVSACSPASPTVTLSSSLDFGQTLPARELVPLSTRPSQTFTVRNGGCQALPVTFRINRTGADVSSGKITNTDDTGTFLLRNITNGTDQEVRAGSTVTIPGFTTWTFRIVFDPKIPAPAGVTANFAASQIIPDTITSTLQVRSGESVLASSNLTGRVDPNSRFINPLAPRLTPLVLFTKDSSGGYTVEASGYDANSNIYLFSYQFFDAAGNRIGQAPNFDLDLSKVNILKGQSFTIIKKFTANECGQNASTVQVYFYDREDYAFATSGAVGTGKGRILNTTSVSAASYSANTLAANSIAAAFGEKFGNETMAAEKTPLPTDLGGVQIFVTDSNMVERPAQLFFVSPYQINYLIPAGTASGNAKVAVAYKGEVVSNGTMMVNDMAPGIFTANSDGTGVPAAYAVRVKPDNSQLNESVFQYDQIQKKFVAAPISLGPADEQVFLVLFGTGLRYRTSLQTVQAKIGGVDAEVMYAGEHGSFVGVDQINLRVPRSLLVSGEIDLVLTVDGKQANPVRVNVK